MDDLQEELYKALFSRSADDVEKALIAGANPNLANAHGTVALHWAVQNALVNIVRLLLQHGSSVNIKNWVGDYPIRYIDNTAYHAEITKLLIAAGANINSLCWGNKSLVDVFISHHTVVDTARERDIVKFLIRSGINISDCYKGGDLYNFASKNLVTKHWVAWEIARFQKNARRIKSLTQRLLPLVAGNPKILKYLDDPPQELVMAAILGSSGTISIDI